MKKTILVALTALVIVGAGFALSNTTARDQAADFIAYGIKPGG